MRRKALNVYDITDIPDDPDFEEIAVLASQICGTPMSMVNFVFPDRQYTKSNIGIDVRWMQTDQSFCIHAIDANETMIVSDTHKDTRFEKNALVTDSPNVRFYAGALVKNEDGVPLGSVCVLDTKPRELSADQINALEILSRQAFRLFDRRKLELQYDRESRLRKMIMDSAIDFAIVSTDPDGTIVSWNTGAEIIMGWTSEETVGSNIDLFFTKEDESLDRSEHEMARALQEGSANDIRWHVRKNGEKFWADGRMTPLLDARNRPHGFVKIVRDKTDQHNRSKRRQMLNEEIVHRLKNTVTVVQSLAQQTIRNATSLPQAGTRVGERLASFANAQNILLQNDWSPEDIHVVIDTALKPHQDYTKQVSIAGSNVLLPAQRLIGLSLALHELMTNSIKHGALSVQDGHVDITGSHSDDDKFEFHWNETNGPPVKAPVQKGFGSKILSSVTSSYFTGTSKLGYEKDGFSYDLYGTVPHSPKVVHI